jgi:uncharacterized protein YggE
MDEERGVIRVSATERGEVRAHAARIHVTVESERLAFGNAALDASRELADLVGRLLELGVGDDATSVRGVHSSTKSGLLSKETRTVYTVAVRIDDLGRMGEYLGAISVHKSAVSSWVEWLYDEHAASAAGAAAALRVAEAKARVMAQAVACELAGLKSASDTWSMPETAPATLLAAASAQARGAGGALDIGMDFTSTRDIVCTVTADFWIAPPDGP